MPWRFSSNEKIVALGDLNVEHSISLGNSRCIRQWWKVSEEGRYSYYYYYFSGSISQQAALQALYHCGRYSYKLNLKSEACLWLQVMKTSNKNQKEKEDQNFKEKWLERGINNIRRGRNKCVLIKNENGELMKSKSDSWWEAFCENPNEGKINVIELHRN